MSEDIKTKIYCEKNNIPYPRRIFNRMGEEKYFEYTPEGHNGPIKIYEKDFNLGENDIEYINRFKEIININ